MSIERLSTYLKAYDQWAHSGTEFTITREGAQFILLALDDLAGQVAELTERLDGAEWDPIGKLVTQTNDHKFPIGTVGYSEEGLKFRRYYDKSDKEETWQVQDPVNLQWKVSDVYAAEMDKVRITSVPGREDSDD